MDGSTLPSMSAQILVSHTGEDLCRKRIPLRDGQALPCDKTILVPQCLAVTTPPIQPSIIRLPDDVYLT